MGDYTAKSLVNSLGLIPVSEILKRSDALRNPVRPVVDSTSFVMINTIETEKKENQAERVLSAHVLPKKFPVDPDKLIYPPLREKNPLYYTTSSTYGNEKPRSHQVAEAFFPKSNKFSKSYTDSKPRYCGLNTSQDAPPTGGEI